MFYDLNQFNLNTYSRYLNRYFNLKLSLFLTLFLMFSIHANAAPKCRVLWGEIKSIDKMKCQLQQISTGKPSLVQIQKKIKKNAHQVNLKLKLTVKNMASLNGLQVRFLLNGNIMFQYDLPLFKDSMFSIIHDDISTQLTIPYSQLTLKNQTKSDYDEVQLYIDVKDKESFALNIDSISWDEKKPKKGAISLTFDDGYSSQYEAAKIMQKSKIPGVAYLIPEAINKTHYLTTDQVADLKKWNWDLSSHYQTPMTDLKSDEISNVIIKIINGVKEHTKTKTYEHFAYPLGRYNQSVIQVIPQYFKTARLASGGFETLPAADLYRLRAINVTPQSSPEDLIKKAKDAINNGDWAIFMFHYIDEPDKNDLNYSLSNFETFINGIKQHKDSIKTISTLTN